MRSTILFLVGCVLGATGVLLYLTETQRLVAAAPPAAVSHGSPVVVRPNGSPPDLRPATSAQPGSNEPVIIPVQGVTADHIKRSFNDSRGFRLHHALDILAPRNTPVLAAVPGTIKKLFVSRDGGITIYEFDRNQEREYYYAHLDHYATFLREGMNVEQGDVIGYVGTTGNAPANTPHLHFAVSILPPTKEWWKGQPIDPYPLLVP